MKRTFAYQALLMKDRADTESIGVVFPELPDCISAGDDLDQACAMAQEGLALHLQGMLVDGEALPQPAGLDAPLPDWLTQDGLSVEIGRLLIWVEVMADAVPA